MKKTYRWLLTCAAGLCLALLVMPGTAKAACSHPRLLGEEPTCTEPGMTPYGMCPDCGEYVAPTTIPARGHSWVNETTAATCTNAGQRSHYCNACGLEEVLEVLKPLGHNYADYQPARPSTDCQPGTAATQKCTRCDHIIGGEATPPAKEHTIVEIKETETTTRGEWCSVCGTWLLKPVNKDQHTSCEGYEVIVPAKEPTCTEPGRTEGLECSVCGKELKKSVIIPARGHTETVTVSYRAATCTREGRTEEIRCSVCGVVLQWSESIPATGHTVVNIPRLEPTETEPGHTAGSYCSDCGTVFTESVEIPATGGNTGGNTGDNPGGNTGGTETPVGPGDNGEPGDEEDLEDPDTPLADRPFLFEDVAKGKWYYDAIYYVYQRGLMNGNNKSGTLFSPNENTNRAMIVTILDLLTAENDLADLMVPLAGEPKSFPDVLVGKWYTEHVLWATAAGIVGGYKEGNFGPLDDVTREQLVVILYQYAGKLGADQSGRADLSGYEDADKVSRYAREAMEWAVDLGLLTGRKDGGVVRLDPKGTATRAEVAVVMMNFCKLVVDAE